MVSSVGPQILVVEDDTAVRNLISTTLDSCGYRHISATTGHAAIAAAATQNPSVMLLDLGLPDMDGVNVVRKVRTWSQMPIIVVSARCEDTDKIEALDAGADDYLTKPFSVGELLARVRVTLRRLEHLFDDNQAAASSFVNGDLRIDYAAAASPSSERTSCISPPSSTKLLWPAFRGKRDKVLTHPVHPPAGL